MRELDIVLNVVVWNDSNDEAENSGEFSLHSFSLTYQPSYQNYPDHALNNLKSSRKYHLNVIFSEKQSKRLLYNTKRESYQLISSPLIVKNCGTNSTSIQ